MKLSALRVLSCTLLLGLGMQATVSQAQRSFGEVIAKTLIPGFFVLLPMTIPNMSSLFWSKGQNQAAAWQHL